MRCSTYAAVTGSGRHRDAAEAALATVAVVAEQAPRFAGWSLAAAQAMLDGPVEVAVVGDPTEERDALERRARRHPGAVVVVADEPDDSIPLLVGPDCRGRPAHGVRLPGLRLRPPGDHGGRAGVGPVAVIVTALL